MVRMDTDGGPSRQTGRAYLSRAADHDVVAMAVSDAQDVGGYAVACARQRELLDGSVQSVAIGAKFHKLISIAGYKPSSRDVSKVSTFCTQVKVQILL